MPLFIFGVSHKTAPIALRERVAFPETQVAAALSDAQLQIPDLEEIAILSTCNRTEVYCALKQRNGSEVARWLSQIRKIKRDELDTVGYQFWDHDMARHMARVAAGLDSMVLGEPQIFGQLKQATDVARQAGTLGPRLDRLMQHTFSIAKRVRSDTDIGRNPISVAYAAVGLAEQIFSDLKYTSALLLGAGDTIELVARHLKERGLRKMVIANRTLANARELAHEVGAEAVLLTDINRHLADADIVFSSTASPLPILGKGAVENALRQRKHRPMFMVDIAVPRDIEPEVKELADVYLYTVDDLSAIVEDNVKSRRRAAEQAETVVEQGIAAFLRDQRGRDAQDTLKALRQQVESLRNDELQRAIKELKRGVDAEEVLKRFAHDLTNKLLHRPSVALRNASADDRQEVIRTVHEMFDLGSTRE